MSRLLLVLTVAGALVLQTSLVPVASLGGVRPDLSLAWAVAVSLAFGPREGLLVAVAAGAVQDLVTAYAFGLFSLAKVVAVGLAYRTGRKVYGDRFLVPGAAGLAASLLHEATVAACLAVTGLSFPWNVLVPRVLGQGAYDALLAVLLLPVAARLKRSLGGGEPVVRLGQGG